MQRSPSAAWPALLALGAVGVRGWHLSQARGDRRAILSRMVPAYAVVAVSLLLYGASLPEGPLGLEGDATTVLAVLWPIVWLAGGVPTLFMELSLRSMDGARQLETRRVFESGRAGLIVALAVAWLGVLNYVGNVWDKSVDLGTVKEMTPSGATLQLASQMTKPVKVALFFPPSNEVGQRIAPYFEALDAQSDMITVEWVDQEADPITAEAMTVRRNGTVVLSLTEDQREKIILSTEEKTVEPMLKRLDKDVERRLARLTRGERVAYFVSGHGERLRTADKEDASRVSALTDFLQQQNYRVKPLGISEGLSESVPDNATMVFLIGPRSPLLESEVASLQRYVASGGSLMLLLDPEVDKAPNLGPLLADLGVVVDAERLINETKFVFLSGGLADRAILYSRRVSRHESTTTLTKIIGENNLLFPVTGSVRKANPGEGGPNVQITVRAVGGTFADLNRNFKLDPETEKQEDLGLVAAVELAPKGKDKPGGRAIVVADADLVTDLILANSLANKQFAADAVHWLERDVELSGEVAGPDDVKIMHTRDEDKAWFYGTVLGFPLLVLGAGIAMRLGRRRKEREEA